MKVWAYHEYLATNVQRRVFECSMQLAYKYFMFFLKKCMQIKLSNQMK